MVNQYFNVPQVGELIRDLWLLNTLQENIEYHKQREEHMKNGDEKDMPMPQYPDDQNIDVVRDYDPPMAQTLNILK